jgi:hypothetical protein
MRDAIVKTIDDFEYTFRQLNARKSIKLFARIVKLIGPSLGYGLEGQDLKKIMDKPLNYGPMLEKLCARIDEDEVMVIIMDLLDQTTVKGMGEVTKCFDEHFGGQIGHLMKVIIEAFKAEYGNFLAGKLGLKGI